LLHEAKNFQREHRQNAWHDVQQQPAKERAGQLCDQLEKKGLPRIEPGDQRAGIVGRSAL
jgi:hypothetical protein